LGFGRVCFFSRKKKHFSNPKKAREEKSLAGAAEADLAALYFIEGRNFRHFGHVDLFADELGDSVAARDLKILTNRLFSNSEIIDFLLNLELVFAKVEQHDAERSA
jgi:hypothetical protein